MATDILEKVRKLIALTASDNLNEAKAAAYQACKLIREHKLHVIPEAPARPSRPAYPYPPSNGDVSDLWDTLFRTQSVPYPPYPPKSEEVPRRKFFCDGCKTECPATYARGKQAFCERCRDDFDRVVREDAERQRQERERYQVYGPSIDFDMKTGTFSNVQDQPRAGFDEANRLRRARGFGPLTEEEFSKAFYR